MDENDYNWKMINMIKGAPGTQDIIKKISDKEQWKWKNMEEEIAVKEPEIRKKIW